MIYIDLSLFWRLPPRGKLSAKPTDEGRNLFSVSLFQRLPPGGKLSAKPTDEGRNLFSNPQFKNFSRRGENFPKNFPRHTPRRLRIYIV